VTINCSVQDIDIGRCFALNCTPQDIAMGNCTALPVFPDPEQADEVIDIEANQTNRVDVVPSGQNIVWVTGTALLEDGSACGTENEFFGVHGHCRARG
jgi:hypothetical protein